MKSKKQFLYQKLAAQIADQIQSGVYQGGQKLPSIGKLTRNLSKSVSTVYRAYVELEFMGLIEARPKSGYYVKTKLSQRTEKKPSFPLAVYSAQKDLSDYADEIRFDIKQSSFIPLGQATLSTELLPQKTISKILKDITPRQMQKLLSYGQTQGDAKLRHHLTRRMVGLIDPISPDQIVVTSGCMEAIAISLMAVTKPGDTIAVESPTYFGYMQVLKELKLSIVEIPTLSDQGIDLDCFAKAVKQYFPAGTSFSLPLGGFVLWIKLPGKADSLRLYQEAIADGIAILPGFFMLLLPKLQKLYPDQLRIPL